MHDLAGTPPRRMQSELLAERVMDALGAATFADQGQARDARRYAARIEFSLRRVEGLRAVADAAQSAFVEARLRVALEILENHVVTAAGLVDAVVRGRAAAGVRERAVVEDAAAAREARAA